ncbi:GNAT family N-acetyltransferase [Nitrincola iocasae]|uniref:GNAT family N-acetyltransferase n=2 Tax=Nitrincola iocasae TaxID=2614693 RepID=A0A5J6LA84_9GAMM|nr:GNAT family N-acetyltransferase [Nitrincola iocasae]
MPGQRYFLFVSAYNTLMSIQIRLMQPTDLPSVWQVQCACYSHFEPETQASLGAKREASPQSCFVAEQGDILLGYVIAMPWLLGVVPALNDPSCNLPAQADCLYLHDMAIAPAAAGQGVGQRLFEAVTEAGYKLELSKLALTAIEGAKGYWQRHGFVPVALPLSAAKVAQYGGNITYMSREMHSC